MVAFGLGVPQLAQPPHPLGLVVGPVVRLGEVVRQVEQLPAVLVEVAAAGRQFLFVEHTRADVIGRGLPALVVDGARPSISKYCVCVDLGARRGPRARQQAGPVDPLLGHAVDLVGYLEAGRGQDRGHEVDGVAELRANRPRLGHAAAPSAR